MFSFIANFIEFIIQGMNLSLILFSEHVLLGRKAQVPEDYPRGLGFQGEVVN